jgi:hypothetical protein
MEKNRRILERCFRSLGFLTYLSLAVGGAGFAYFYFEKFHLSVRDMPLLNGAAALTMLGLCSSVALKILRIFDARLKQIEDSSAQKTP